MDKKLFQTLYEYNVWANAQVWACVEALSEEDYFKENPYSLGSVHTQCLHTLGVEYWWLHFLKEGELEFLYAEEYPTREAVKSTRAELETYVRDYLEHLDDDELKRLVRPAFWEDDQPPIPVWGALLQVFNHGTDHRAQTLAALHQLGAPTVEQDFLNYLHRDVQN